MCVEAQHQSAYFLYLIIGSCIIVCKPLLPHILPLPAPPPVPPPTHTPQLANRLFDVEIVAADGESRVWHPDVRFFKVLMAGKPKAYFYLDPYSRQGRAGTWGPGGMLWGQ